MYRTLNSILGLGLKIDLSLDVRLVVEVNCDDFDGGPPLCKDGAGAGADADAAEPEPEASFCVVCDSERPGCP